MITREDVEVVRTRAWQDRADGVEFPEVMQAVRFADAVDEALHALRDLCSGHPPYRGARCQCYACHAVAAYYGIDQ